MISGFGDICPLLRGKKLVTGAWADKKGADTASTAVSSCFFVSLRDLRMTSQFPANTSFLLSVLRQHLSLFNLPQKCLLHFHAPPLSPQRLCISCHAEFSEFFTVGTAVRIACCGSPFKENANEKKYTLPLIFFCAIQADIQHMDFKQHIYNVDNSCFENSTQQQI